MQPPDYDLQVLGVTRLRACGEEVPLTAAEASLLACLALSGPAGASDDRLVEVLWPAGSPQTGLQSLRNHASRLRGKAGEGLLARSRTGYHLGSEVRIDAVELEVLLAAARSADERDDVEGLVAAADAATALVTGAPYHDLGADRIASGARSRLREELLRAEEVCATALVRAGRLDRAIADLQRMTRIEPAREARWELLLTALGEAGRRSDALEVYHEARRALIGAYGVEPGARLRRLHDAVLQGSVEDGPAAPAGAAVGREEDVAALVAAVADGRTTVLIGEPGIGKSTVLRLTARAWPGPVVLVDCQENPWTALGPVQDLLTRLTVPLQALGLPTDLAQLRPSAPPESWDRPRRPDGLIGRAADVIAAGLTALDSVLVLVDDVDRSGPTTRQIIVTALTQAGIGSIFAARAAPPPDLAGLDPVERRLSGLDAEALAAMVAAAGADDPGDAGRWLLDHTGGNPMFAGELLRVVADRRPWARTGHAGVQVDDLDGMVLPGSLVMSLQQRLARLPAACRPALDTVAVMGDPIDLSVLRRLVDVGLLTPLLDAQVLVRTGDGQVRFGHALLRRVAYDQVPPGRRQELHHAVGLLCTLPAVRAHHLSRGLALDPHAAIAAMVAAGRAAAAEHAHADAHDWFGRAAAEAVTVGLPPLQVLDLRLEACDSARLAGRPGHAAPLLDLAEEVVEAGHLDLRRRATVAAVQLSEAVDPGPLQQRAARLADRAIAAEDDPGWRARLNATASILHSMAGDTGPCRRMFLAALEDLDPGDDALVCDVLPYAYLALGHPDDLDRREELAGALLAAALRLDDHAAQWEANHLRTSTAMMRGDGPALRWAVGECERLVVQLGDAGRRWSVGYLRAAVAAIDGRHEEAEALSAEAMALGAGVAPGRAMSAWSAQLLALRWEQGRLDELGDTIRYLIDAQPEIAAWQGAGCLILAGSDPVRAAQLFDAATAADLAALPRDFTWLVGVLVLAGGAVRLGDPDRAAVIAPALDPYTDLVCWQGSCSYGPVAAVAADVAQLCGRPDRAAVLRRRAEELRRSLTTVAPAAV